MSKLVEEFLREKRSESKLYVSHSKYFGNDNGDGTFRCNVCGKTCSVFSGHEGDTDPKWPDDHELICDECWNDKTLW